MRAPSLCDGVSVAPVLFGASMQEKALATGAEDLVFTKNHLARLTDPEKAKHALGVVLFSTSETDVGRKSAGADTESNFQAWRWCW